MKNKLIVVNSKGRKIGYEDKEKCHRGWGILHRAFTVLIFREAPKNEDSKGVPPLVAGRGWKAPAENINLLFNNKNQVLIQKRSRFKRLWPLTWETSCSSHPKKGEKILPLARKRLKEELNFTCALKSLGSFKYQASYKKIGSENEVCHLLIGKYNGKVKPNPKEVSEWEWIDFEGLKRELRKNPKRYAPWLKISVRKFLRSG